MKARTLIRMFLDAYADLREHLRESTRRGSELERDIASLKAQIERLKAAWVRDLKDQADALVAVRDSFLRDHASDRDRIAQLEAELAERPRWVDCSDRLPPKEGAWLVRQADEYPWVRLYSPGHETHDGSPWAPTHPFPIKQWLEVPQRKDDK